MASRKVARPVVLALAAALVGSAPAAAHLVTTGLGPFYDGVGHLALTPEDLMSALAIALCAGLRGKGHGRAALLALPAAWLAGGWIGLAAAPQADTRGSALTLLVLGVLVASDVPWSRRWTILLASAVGAMHGFLNGGALASSIDGRLAVAGVAAAVAVTVALVAAFVASLEAPWTRIAVRVAGSWIAAVGLLMLGWWIQPT